MIRIDERNGLVIVGDKKYKIGTPEAFNILSKLWLRSGWDMKYIYSFTWLGRPIIQLPEDMFRIQEIIYKVKPDVIIETGIAHGGSLVFYASLCKAMGKGRVISVDIEIRPHNRKAIEEHELFDYATIVEGNSIENNIVNIVKALVKPREKCLVVLDSKHTKDHILAELYAYSGLVAIGSYIIVQDGWKEWLVGAPRTEADWNWNNPKTAVEEFIKRNDNFIVEEPSFIFNEGQVTDRVTACPKAFVKRIK
jgi:cephalosporin hydroxylase